jgi:hypothetical protein
MAIIGDVTDHRSRCISEGAAYSSRRHEITLRDAMRSRSSARLRIVKDCWRSFDCLLCSGAANDAQSDPSSDPSRLHQAFVI